MSRAIDKYLVPESFVFFMNNSILFSIIGMLFLLLAPLVALVCGLPCEDLLYPLCITMMIVVLWMFFTFKHITSDAFNPYVFFVFAAILFNGGQSLLEVFNLNETGILDSRFSSDVLVHTLYLVILSLVCLHVGGLLGAQAKKPSGRNVLVTESSLNVSAKALRRVGSVLFVISSIPFFMLIMDALRTVLNGGYFALYGRDAVAGVDSGFEGVKAILSGFFVPGMFFLLVGSKDRPVTRNILFVTLFVCVCVYMFLGSRSSATTLFIAALWVWHRTVRKISLFKISAVGAALLFFVFPTIQLIRNVEGTSRLTWQVVADAFLAINNPAVAAVSEMGRSMGTIAYTLQLIPTERPFAMGSTYAFAATSIIPNFFWDLHPSVVYGSLGRWLTMTVDPYTFSIGGGLGYSFIAEAYANFGWVGVPIVMGLIGFAMAKLTRWASDGRDYARIVVIAGCIVNVLLWARGDVTVFFRSLVSYTIVPYLLFLLVRNKLQKKMRARS